MTTKYTPGPWILEQDDWHIYAPCGGHTGLVAGCGGHSCNRRDLQDEQRANARLIAAAPDLLEAAEETRLALSEHACCLDDIHPQCKWGIVYKHLEAAINKVTGE